jgi:ATP-binding cassette subfamily B protein
MNENKLNMSYNAPTTPRGYFWHVTRTHKWWMFSALLVVIIGAVIDQSVSYLFKLIVDSVESGNTQRVFWLGLSFPVILFCSQIVFRVSGLLAMKWSVLVRKDGFDYLFAHALNHSHSYFSNRFAGSIHNKIKNVVDGLDQLIPEVLWTYVYSFVAMAVTFGFIFSVDILSSVIFLLLVLVLLTLNTQLAPKKQALSKLNAQASSTLHSNMIDVLSNISAYRQYTGGAKEKAFISNLTNKYRQANQNSWSMTEYMLFVNTCVLFLFSFGMFYLLINRWQEGLVTTGQFVLVASLITQLSGTLLFIGRAFNSTARTIGEMKEGLEDLMVPYEIIDRPDAKELQVTQGGSIVWDAVDFNFTENPNAVFEKFNLTIKPGQRIGLVGASGAGKSTFVSLLLRQHDVTSGAIMIDEQNIAEVTQDSLRRAIAVVPQEPALFHRSIRENIMYGKTDATEAEMIEVAKKAQAHDFIMALPEGYSTLVGERGVKLSGGQKQRVAIARAMLKDAPILVLDEATSALDSESEVEIQKALHILMNGKTVIAVAHRLSTLREMDRIIVLENGKIIEDGTHETLKDAGGTYAKLWNHQAGGFVGE